MTRLLRWISLGSLLGVMLLAASQTASAADAMSGKWELNVRNSIFEPGPAPKSATRTQQLDGDTLTVTYDIVAADGQTQKVQYTAKLDGSDQPLTGAPNGDTISFKRLDARTLEYTVKKDGKTTRKGKHRVSVDGSELEISAKGTDEKGVDFEDLMVFDKR